MADLATLRDLRDRLANATGPDRELDALIECVLPDKWCVEPTMTERPGFVVSSYRIGGRRSRWKAPATTTSIDAAVALCSRVLPGWRVHLLAQSYDGWSACLHRMYGSPEADHAVWKKGHHWPSEDMARSDGAAPALALCRAIVEGLIAQDKANG